MGVSVLSMGIDVSLSRGLDVVLMAEDRSIVWARERVEPEEVQALLLDRKPGVVAIDSPPGPGNELDRATRECEQQPSTRGEHLLHPVGP